MSEKGGLETRILDALQALAFSEAVPAATRLGALKELREALRDGTGTGPATPGPDGQKPDPGGWSLDEINRALGD